MTKQERLKELFGFKAEDLNKKIDKPVIELAAKYIVTEDFFKSEIAFILKFSEIEHEIQTLLKNTRARAMEIFAEEEK